MEADEPWWLDYLVFLPLIGVGASMAVLRVAGAVDGLVVVASPCCCSSLCTWGLTWS